MRFRTAIPIPFSMMPEVLSVAHAKNRLPRTDINSICTDSRIAERDDIFFSFEKNPELRVRHVKEAKARGAVAVSEENFESDITVGDTVAAFMKLASFYKSFLHPISTVAITGSNGKTTTKELSLSLLSEKYKVHATRENLNNEIGVPYTLLTAPRDTEILLIEAGMNHANELDRISECISPDVAVITNIGSAHIGNLGSREGIAKAKLEILSSMKSPYLIAPIDEPLLEKYRTKSTSLSDRSADFCLIEKYFDENSATYDFFSENLNIKDLTVNYVGRHIAPCLTFALALASIFGEDENAVRGALLSSKARLTRSRLIGIGDFYVIDDSYNSSKEAVSCALGTLDVYKNHMRSAVIGDMLELGAMSESMHEEVGRLCAEHKLDRLYTFGNYAEATAYGAERAGLARKRIFINEDVSSPEITATEILNNVMPGEVILVKGSHAIGLERIIDILKERHK